MRIQKQKRRALARRSVFPRALSQLTSRPPVNASRGLVGESPCPGASTTTVELIFTRLNRSIASSLVNRMQPDEIAEPIYSGWLVPWMR